MNLPLAAVANVLISHSRSYSHEDYRNSSKIFQFQILMMFHRWERKESKHFQLWRYIEIVAAVEAIEMKLVAHTRLSFLTENFHFYFLRQSGTPFRSQ